MSSDTGAYLYLHFSINETAQRFQFFIDEDTRPDFVDEVPENEAPLVELFELMPDVAAIDWPSETECLLYFDDDVAEAKNLFPQILRHMPTRFALWCEADFDYCHYYRFDGHFFDFLYSPEPLESEEDEEEHNQQLSEALVALITKKREEGGTATSLISLGRALIEKN